MIRSGDGRFATRFDLVHGRRLDKLHPGAPEFAQNLVPMRRNYE